MAAEVDLDAETRSAVEFDALLALVAGHAATPLGARRVLALAPSTRAEAIAGELGAVSEAALHLRESGRLVSGGLPDPAPALAVLPVVGVRAHPSEMRDLAVVLLAAADLRGRLAGLGETAFPRLRRLGGSIPDLRAESRPVERGVLPDGTLADEASAELTRIRGTIARVGDRLRRMLESVLRDPGSGGVVRDDFITQRNGRYVIPVRSDAHRQLPGIVHASSSSGATLFVEPLESIELNNELVRLAEAEAEERDRIVAGWLDRFRARAPDVAAAVDAIASADSLQARALYAHEAGAVCPQVRVGGPLRLDEARHPLLDRRLRDRGERAVPSRIELGPDERVLLLSGPNTGGKTVALKTIALAVLGAQSGIPVSAASAELPLYVQVRADIGDHQSLDADLSTFSAHMDALSRFLREASPPALFLLDEIGTGTDPAEGVAIAQAALERLVGGRCTTVATTHQGALKAWAFTTPGAASAALEFDTERLRPTYRIVPGAAGVSAGVEVAARVGLDPEIVARARTLLGGGDERAETYLERLREELANAERLSHELAGRTAELEAERERLDRRAAADAARRKQEAATALDEALREFREEGRREIAALGDARERLRLERERVRVDKRLAADVVRRKAQLATGPEAEGAPLPSAPVRGVPGERVLVFSLGKVGEIVSVRADRVDVRLGSAVFAVSRADLRAVAPEPPARTPIRPTSSPRAVVDDLTGGGRELLLLGKTVEEAIEALDKFLDSAALEGQTELRVIHGHGTGRLRVAVRRFLTGHPHVEAHRPGDPREGGDGATVVRLK